MSRLGIAIRIDVSKLDKSRFYKGQKGTYADLTVFVDPDNVDQFGNNGSITESATKEERAAKKQMPFVGNARVFYKDHGTPRPGNHPNIEDEDDSNLDDIPF